MNKKSEKSFTPLEISSYKGNGTKFLTGLTLIELMVTVAILAIGVAGVTRGLITVASALNHAENKILASRILDSYVLELYERSLGGEDSFEQSYGGEVKLANKRFNWRAAVSPLLYDGIEHNEIKEINLKTTWSQASRQRQEKLTFYIFFEGE